MWYPGMHLAIILLCSGRHTSMLSLQLAALLSELRHFVCVCVPARVVQAHCALNPNQPGIFSACLKGSGVALCCQPGPCITFKEVSVCPSPYHSSSPPPPPWLVEAPLGMPGTLGSICVQLLYMLGTYRVEVKHDTEY